MGLEGVDIPAIGGGLSILGAMIFIIRLTFSRLDRQDSSWMELLEAAERRAEAAEKTLVELRAAITRDKIIAEELRANDRGEIRMLEKKLSAAELEIKKIQRWVGPDELPK